MKVKKLFLALSAILLQKNHAFAMCALCKQALESGGNGGLIRGFYWSILLIGGIPLIVFAFGIPYIRKQWK